MFGASAACCSVIRTRPRSGRTAAGSGPASRRPARRRPRYGVPSFIASVGVSVTRGRLPGSITLNGSVARSGDEALRALAEPDAGAARDHRRDPAAARRDRHHPALLVGGLDRRRAGVERFVERRVACRLARASRMLAAAVGVSGAATSVQRASIAANGFVPPWNGYGSPGLTRRVVPRPVDQGVARAFAYSFDSSPCTGSSGGNAGSP